MEYLEKLEQRVEAVVTRIKELEAVNANLQAENKSLAEQVEKMQSENNRLSSENQQISVDFDTKEKKVKNRLESLLSQVERVELEVK